MRKGQRGKKTARAIEPNAGVTEQYQKQIIRAIKKLRREYIHDILEFVKAKTKNSLAQDAPRGTMLDDIVEFLSGLTARFAVKIRGIFGGLVDRMTRRQVRHVTAAQKKALTDAGINPKMLRTRWTVPTVRGQYISRAAAEALPGIIAGNTELISGLASKSLDTIQKTVIESTEQGLNTAALESVLRTLPEFDAGRAKRVAIDQVNKISQSVQRANNISLGMTRAVWIHVPGQYTSRQSHIKMGGQEFDLREGLYDPEVGHNIQPAELPYCRCIYRTVIPEDLLANE